MAESKIMGLSDALIKIQELQKNKSKIVFTNGCFDILHRGHVTYLEEARRLGDMLIVGLNNDKSVQMQEKSVARPLQSQESRAAVLSALESVDMVILFEDPTPATLIDAIIPDVLVKGGDYKAKEVVGYHTVTQNGGKVVILPFLKGYSTTDIEIKILKAHGVNPKSQ
jgi:D-beta-D-heptose 7-phosphate kinase/D-beta-D-heptose 1-phosphate adenosyltransferase